MALTTAEKRKRYVAKNHAKILEEHRRYRVKNREKLEQHRQEKLAPLRRLILETYKARGGCKDCGRSDPRGLTFDHLDPKEKKFGISRASGGGLKLQTIEALKDEIAKCDVVCGYCHHIRSAVRGNFWTNWFK